MELVKDSMSIIIIFTLQAGIKYRMVFEKALRN
jgi:hypothetical protein